MYVYIELYRTIWYNIIVQKESVNMLITSTELKNNLGKYLDMAKENDIYITKNGKTVAKLSSPYQTKIDLVNELYGSVPDSIDFDEVKKERLNRI